MASAATSGTIDVTLPNGTVIKGVPVGTTKAQLAQKLTAKGFNVPKEWMTAAKAGTATSGKPIGESGEAPNLITQAVGYPAAKALAGAAGGIVGGVAGLARGAGAAAGALEEGQGVGRAIDAGTTEAASTIEGVEKAFTPKPTTPVERTADKVASYPFEKLAQGADYVGQHTSNAVSAAAKALGVSKETAERIAAAAGASVNTAVQSLPALFGVRAGRGAEAGETGEELTAAGGARQAPSTVGEKPPTPAPAAPPPDLETSGAARQPPSTVGEGPVPRETPPPSQVSPGAPGAAQPPPAGSPAPNPQTARAMAYASRIGLDWARLGMGTRKALESIAQDATALDRLNPAAVRRQAHLESLRVPVRATRGQLERDPVQLRREAIASNTDQGQRIREIDAEANRDLQANLEVLRGRVAGRRGGYEAPLDEEGREVPGALRGPTKAPSAVGESVQGALRERAKWSKKAYEALYKRAEATEPDALAGTKPVTDLLAENPDIQHIGWVQSWLSKAKAAKAAKTPGASAADADISKLTLKELYDLRKLATKNMAKGSTTAHYAAQVREAVDTAMADVPEGAAAWKKATDAFRAHQEEFKDKSIIRSLSSVKKGTSDPAVEAFKAWDKVSKSSPRQIRQLKESLIRTGTREQRIRGAKAWADIRAETVNRILEGARNVTAADEYERSILTEAALRKAVKSIPRENLEELIGKGATAELLRIVRARRITTRSPVGGRTTQSGTVPNALALAEKAVDHIPYVGAANRLRRMREQLVESSRQRAAERQAQVSPLEQAARDVASSRDVIARTRAARRQAQYADLERAGPTLPGAPPQPLPIGQVIKPPP